MQSLRTIQRHILGEIFRVFFTSVSIVTVFLFLFMTLQIWRRYQLSLNELISVIVFIVPMVLFYTIPLAILVTMIFAYGRMVADNEVLAMSAGGVNLWHVVSPALLAGSLLSIFSVWMNHEFTPVCESALKDRTSYDIGHIVRILGMQHTWDAGRLTIGIKGMEGNFFTGVTIYQETEDAAGKKHTTIEAEKAYFTKGPEGGIINANLLNGSHLSWDEQTGGRGTRITQFPRYTLSIDLNRIDSRARAVDEYSTSMLVAYRARLRGLLSQTDERAARGKFERFSKQLVQIDVAVQKRSAAAVSCLVFALLGVPLGIHGQHRNLLAALALATTPVMLIYYPLQLLGEGISESRSVGIWPPLWLANLLLGLVGLVLFARLLWRQKID